MATPGAGAMGTGGGGGGGGGPEGNWRATQFRSKVVGQINDALRDACNPIEKSGSELEEHIFNRARDRDSYLSLVARLILHMRDSNAAKEKGLPGRMTPNMPGQQQDPMVALQGLTQMGQSHSPGGPNLQMQPNQMVPGNQGNRPMMRNQMGQSQGGNIMDQRQQQQLQNLQKLMSTPSQPGGMAPGPGGIPPGSGGIPPGSGMHQVVSQAQTQSQPSQQMPHYQGGAMVGGMQQSGFPGPAGDSGNMSHPTQQPGVMGPQGGPNQMGGSGGMGQGRAQMGMPQGQMPQQMQPMVRPQQNFQNPMVMQAQKSQAQIAPRSQVPRSYPVQSTPPIQSRPPMSPYGGYPYMMSPQSVVTDSPAYRQQPSPAQQSQQGSAPGSNPMHSPASYLQPSPSPQGLSIPSPASAGSQRGGPPSVPSPSSMLNTPGNPGSVGSVNPSPGGGMRGGPGSNQGQAELMAYQEKMRYLSKFIEPLKKTIMASSTREDSGGLSATDISKMKGLLEIIANPNPNKKLTLTQLNKCEQYLEGFEQVRNLLAANNSTSTTATSATATTSSATSTLDTRMMGKTNMFQPLLDAVKANIDSPYINHTLQRTFGPALTTLQGNPPHFPSPPAKKLKTDHDHGPTTQTPIPNIIQGEVARLAPKFRVNLDPMFHTSSKDVHLVCRLDDKHLPSVPPINVAIPEQYPELSPNYDVSQQEYSQTPFLKLVQGALQNQVMRMPDRYTLTQILDAWEMSVRKSCLKMIAARDAT